MQNGYAHGSWGNSCIFILKKQLIPMISIVQFSFADIVGYATLPLALIVFFIIKSRNKSKFGLNFSRVYCPSCQTKQPIIRMPQNERQTLYGGWTCEKCKTEMDKYGQVVDPEDHEIEQ